MSCTNILIKHNMKWNRTSRQYYNEKYQRNQAVQTIGRNTSKTEVNIKAQYRVATNLENMEHLENSGNLKNCQNFMENSGKFAVLLEKPGKLREKKYVA